MQGLSDFNPVSMPHASLQKRSTHTKRLFLAVLAIVGNEQRFTKGCAARDSLGIPCLPWSPEACRWCLLGAIVRAAHTENLCEDNSVHELVSVLQSAIGRGETIAEYNDANTREKISWLLHCVGYSQGWLDRLENQNDV